MPRKTPSVVAKCLRKSLPPTSCGTFVRNTTTNHGAQWLVGSREPTADDFKGNKWLHEAVHRIRAIWPKQKGGKATWVKFAPEKDLGPPQRCIMNVANYVKAHPGTEPVRCFKLFTESSRNKQRHLGAKAVLHYVVRLAGGELLDVTCEPGDTSTYCVPAHWFPDVTDEELLSSLAHMGGFIIGEPERVGHVLHLEGEDRPEAVATTEDPASVKIRISASEPPHPWNGVLARDDPEKQVQLALDCCVALETIQRWIDEAEADCVALGWLPEGETWCEDAVDELGGRAACNELARATDDAYKHLPWGIFGEVVAW